MIENSTKKTVFIVEDDKHLNSLIQKTLQRKGFLTEYAFNGEDAIARFADHKDMIMLLDYSLPDMTGRDVVKSLTRKKRKVPFIIITGQGDEKLAVEMMKLGARDYIIKSRDFIDVLPHTIEKIENEITLEKELIAAEQKIVDRQLELSVLYEVSSAMSRTINLNELFTIMFNTITGIDILNVEDKGAIFFVEDDRLQLASHVGFSDIFLDLHKNLKVGDCLCGLAAEKGEVIISSNCRKDRRHTIACSRSENHGHFIIPLNARGQVVGVLCLYTHPDIDIDESKLKLLEAIGNQVGVAIDNARLHEETRKYSLHDPLTGLANRRMMHIVFERILNRAKRFDEPFSIIMLDIDHFKKFNDQFGHTEGDRLLKKLARIILEEVRQIDLAVRYGGEEFLVLLPETDSIKACDVAERMRKAVERQTKITISLGISSHKKSMKTHEVFISKADKALYKAKKNGRNRVEKSN